MRFRVGSRTYSLMITAGKLVHEGIDSLSACIQKDAQILIAGDCPIKERPRVLIRELCHAWQMETGTPDSDEGWADLTATVSLGALADLNMQGGDLALMSLNPGESPEPAAARSGLSTARQCAKCNGTVAGGSVIWRPGVLPGVAELRIYCEFCDETQIWREGMNARGMPNNTPLGNASFERGDRTGLQLTEV